MSYFVVVPGALLPQDIAPALLSRAKVPSLERRLRRARPVAFEPVIGAPGAAHLDWLWSRFGGVGEIPVTAPYAWRALNGAGSLEGASALPLWHADPVHFALARDHLLVTPLDTATIPADDMAALAAEAAAAAAEFEAVLRVLPSDRWFLSFDPPWHLEVAPLDAALGQSAQHVMPRGEAAARWRKLHTEIQMRWHQHPVNEQREAQGQRTVNGIWLHGAGAWSALPNRPFATIATNHPVLHGWGLASGLPPSALCPAGTMPEPTGPVLAYWPGLLIAARLADWDEWLAGLGRLQEELELLAPRAQSAGFASVTLVLAGQHSVRAIELRRGDRIRLWRRTPLLDWFAEPEAT